MKGWVRIAPLAADGGVLEAVRQWWLLGKNPEPLTLQEVKRHAESILAKWAGCESKEDADALKGGVIAVARSDFPVLREGEYYLGDMVGYRVLNRQGVDLGKVAGIRSGTAAQWLEVEQGVPAGGRRLFTADSTCRSVRRGSRTECQDRQGRLAKRLVILMMRFDAITLFPSMFSAIVEHGITQRAQVEGRWSLRTWNPREFVADAHRTIDDRPFGGGPGMVMMAQPLADALAAVKKDGGGARVIALAPNGDRLTDARVRRYAKAGESLALVCGRYEGIDQRFIDVCVDEVMSIGDFVLSGGEIAAMALIDAVVRQLPGALKEASAADESFAMGLLDAQHYTRPESWGGIDGSAGAAVRTSCADRAMAAAPGARANSAATARYDRACPYRGPVERA